MTIYKITKKEFRKARRERKRHGPEWEAPALYFEDDDGEQYKCTTKGMQGVKEIADFRQGKIEALSEQLTMFGG